MKCVWRIQNDVIYMNLMLFRLERDVGGNADNDRCVIDVTPTSIQASTLLDVVCAHLYKLLKPKRHAEALGTANTI